jgi:hypothetical protein
MNRSTGLIVALVLLGGSAILITRLMLDNYQLKVEVAELKSKQTAQAKVPPRPAAPAQAAPSAASATGSRELSESARQMMIDALAAEDGPDKVLWMRVDPRDREASNFAGQIAAVFRGQGWEVKQLDNEGMRFKPGLLFLVATEDEPPSSVANAQKAIEAIGEQLTSGRGYQSYYEAKKKEDPKWVGTHFEPGQTHVLLVGRKPPPPAPVE